MTIITLIAALALTLAPPPLGQNNSQHSQGTLRSSDSHTASDCVILKRMGPADEITSHIYSFGIRGKQFQYIEGQLPEGIKFHGRLTDNDVRNIQAKGGRVVIVEPKYTAADLEQARKECQEPPKDANPTKAEEAGQSSIPAGRNSAAPAVAESGTCNLTSTPSGADIVVDGSFVGNTPSVLSLTPGKHVIIVSGKGFREWRKELTINRGSTVSLTATLESEQ